MSDYDDILVRDYFQGIMQDYSRTSTATPDIIPYGQDILTWEKADKEYNKILCDPNHSVISDRNCNCYIRGRNTSPDRTTSGQAQLFLMPFNVFTNPQKWYSLKAYDSHTGKYTETVSMISKKSGQASGQVGPDEVCLSESAFVLNDSYNLKAGEHYCLCAVVNTPYHPIDIPDHFNSNQDMDQWVARNHNVALLNVIPINMQVRQTSFSFDFGNFDRKNRNFMLELRFFCDYDKKENWSEKLPVRIQCTDSRCPFDYPDNSILKRQGNSKYQKIVVPVDDVPPDFYGQCNVYIDNVVPLPAHGYVEMIYYQVMKEIPQGYECEKHRFLPLEGNNGYLFPLGQCFVYNSDMTIHKFYQMKEQAET